MTAKKPPQRKLRGLLSSLPFCALLPTEITTQLPSTHKKILLPLLSAGLAQLLVGCAMYMPMQCAAPQIKDMHRAELNGKTYLNGRYEVAGAYSPVRHLLVRGAHEALFDPDNSLYYRGHQYELSVGAYWPLGLQWLLRETGRL